MLNNKRQKKSGMTLIEVMVYALILTASLAVLMDLLFMLLGFWQNYEIRSSILKNSRFINQLIDKDLDGCYQVILPDNLSFSAELVILSTPSGQLTYRSENGRLYRNSDILTDSGVSIDLSSQDLGFRKIGHTVDYRYRISSIKIPLSGPVINQLEKGTVFLSNCL